MFSPGRGNWKKQNELFYVELFAIFVEESKESQTIILILMGI